MKAITGVLALGILFFGIKGRTENIKVSFRGKIFVRDQSHPDLGEAYRDPSGLIWGSPVPDKDDPNGMLSFTFYQAKTYCKSIGARLPHFEDFNRLAKYLGVVNSKGILLLMNNVAGEPEDQLLPFHGFLWSTQIQKDNHNNALIFDTYHGGYSSNPLNLAMSGVGTLCVVK